MNYSGIVIKGKSYGRTLGFPTANVPIQGLDVSGIFAATAHIDGIEHFAAVYADQKNSTLETYVLDFEGDLYGKEIQVHLREKIRDDQSFVDIAKAKEVIAGDIAATRAYFAVN